MERISRENGILFHISALPGKYGIGTMGKEAYRFVDFLTSCKVNIWQLLPLNLTSYGDSPYQSPSSIGLNFYLIDLDTLIEKKLLTRKEVESFDFGSDENRVNYGLLFDNRAKVLKIAFSRYNKNNRSFLEFVKKGKYSDFAFFMTMKEKNHFSPWYEWEEKERFYSPILEERIKKEYKETYLFYLWTQYEFLQQFKALKSYANRNGISIMGDLPLYLARDSVEAYKYPEMFLFDEKHNPTVVAGVPPDYFNENGQLWGNPIYNWEKMREDNFAWWNERIRSNFELFDIVRIDHFRGIAAYYVIPFGAENAKNGEWRDGPSVSLFEDKKDLPIVAEDLGFIDDKVRYLLQETGYPGMKILEFAFDGDPKNDHKPSNAKYNFIAYTGTHDNEPLLSYLENLDEKGLEVFKKDVKKECKLFAVPYQDKDLKSLVKTVVSLCYATPCRLAILPMADLLALGKEARINTPAELNGINWTYRYKKEDFTASLKNFILKNVETYR